MKEELEALPPEIAMVAVLHRKYWTKAWRDHISSCIARALSTSVQLEGLVKDLRAKNVDLA